MPSRFPGVDPYLEGQVWEDFHHDFITEIRRRLVPQLRPRYAALVQERVVVERAPQDPLRTIIPDVTVAEHRDEAPEPERGGVAVMSKPVSVPLPVPERVREAYLEVRLRETWDVVTVIEVLSPGNKRLGSARRREYLSKRGAVLESDAHLIEIDLLRGGERLPMARPLPPADYYVILSRAEERPSGDVWAFSLREPIPPVPVPLTGGDPDAMVDLQNALSTVYDGAGYDYILDYDGGTTPPLTTDEAAWAESLLRPPQSQ